MYLSIEEIMSEGGDERITIDERGGLNKYGCSPYPKNSLSYASSTASSLTNESYNHVSSFYYENFIKNSVNGRTAFERIRKQIKTLLNLNSQIDIALGPSGTDLELLALTLSLIGEKKKVLNILVGADEVGSGADFAAIGRYFSNITAANKNVEKGELIQGFNSNDILLRKVEIRNQSGTPRVAKDIYEEIISIIESALKKGYKPLLHIVHRSKTGLIFPNWDNYLKIRNKFSVNEVDIVVDACQGRISTALLNRYLEDGCSILFTGSKFYSGAPFSGALLVPHHFTRRLEQATNIPVGLKEFFTKNEWPSNWIVKDDVLTDRFNFGLLLRWETALFEMERFLELPEISINKVIKAFRKSIIDSFTNTSVSDLDESFFDKDDIPYQHPIDLNTIATLILKSDHDFTMSLNDSKTIHKKLNQRNLKNENSESFHVNSLICHLGQPVNSFKNENGSWCGTLRLSLSAPQIYNLSFLSADKVKKRFDTDFERILKKIEMTIQGMNN